MLAHYSCLHCRRYYISQLIFEQRTLVAHLVQIFRRILGSYVFLGPLCLLNIRTPEAELKHTRAQDTEADYAKTGTITSRVSRLFAVEEDVRTDDTTNVAGSQ